MNVILTLTSILIFGFSLLPANLHAAANTYYITQNGSGAKDGKSFSNAWSISNFNSSANWSSSDNANKIDPGDTVYFSGRITSQIEPPSGYGGSSSGGYVTLDGWQGGTCNPVANDGCDNATEVRRTGSSDYGIYTNGNSYLIIQDFDIQSSGNIGIQTGSSSSTHLTIRRNYVHDCYKKGMQISGSGTKVYTTIGGALGDGNYIKDCDIEGRDYSDSHVLGTENNTDLIISYNKIWNNPDYQNMSSLSNLISIHYAENFLVEYNTVSYPNGQACIAKKEFGGNNGIFRFNKLRGCGENGGIDIVTSRGPQTNYYIYGNLVYDSVAGIRLYRNFNNIYIWSNVLHDFKQSPPRTASRAFYIIPQSGCTQGNVYFYNNTLSRSNTDGGDDNTKGSNAYIQGQSNLNIRFNNNLFYYGSSGETYHKQISIASGSEGYLTALDFNTLFSSSTPYVYDRGGNRTVSYMNSQYDVTHNKVSNPGFTDPNGADNIYGTDDDDYTLNGTNINDGENLSDCFDISVQSENYHMCFDDGLDPNATNWTTTPPTVKTTKQGSYGSWERGAYVYTGDSPDQEQLAPPSSLRVIIGN